MQTKMSVDIEQARMREVSRIMNQALAEFMPRGPSWRYFEDSKRNKYFWTTQKVKAPSGNPKFVSGVYRYFKKKKIWIAKKKVYHKRRNAAKARADKLYHRVMQKQQAKAEGLIPSA
jgi:hypothetical protein